MGKSAIECLVQRERWLTLFSTVQPFTVSRVANPLLSPLVPSYPLPADPDLKYEDMDQIRFGIEAGRVASCAAAGILPDGSMKICGPFAAAGIDPSELEDANLASVMSMSAQGDTDSQGGSRPSSALGGDNGARQSGDSGDAAGTADEATASDEHEGSDDEGVTGRGTAGRSNAGGDLEEGNGDRGETKDESVVVASSGGRKGGRGGGRGRSGRASKPPARSRKRKGGAAKPAPEQVVDDEVEGGAAGDVDQTAEAAEVEEEAGEAGEEEEEEAPRAKKSKASGASGRRSSRRKR